MEEAAKVRKTRQHDDGEVQRNTVLVKVIEWLEKYGHPPTRRELGKTMSLAPSGVQHHISKLVNLGLLVRRETGKARALQVTEKGYEVARASQPRSPKHFSVNSMVLPLTNSIARYGQDVKILPALRLRLLGDIAAGVGIEAHENRDADSYIEIAPADANAFALHVRGDSMIGDLIHDGDFVVVLPAQTASDGDIVAAWLRDGLSENGEVTIKRYFRREDGCIRLQPSNPNLHLLILPEHEVQVQGIVISVVRPILGMTRRANQ